MFLLFLSFLAAIVNGLLSPFNVYLLLRPLLSIFIKVETPGNHNINLKTETEDNFAFFGYKYLFFGFLNFFFGFIQIMASERASHSIMIKIKTAYLTKMLTTQMSWFDKSQEQYVSTVSYDLQKMIVLFDSKMTSAVEMLSFLIFGCIAGFYVSWKVALLTLILMIVAMIIIYFIMEASKKKGKKRQQFCSKCTKIASEVLGNPRTVTAYGGEYKEIERFKTTFNKSNKYGLKHATVISVAKAFNYFQLCVCYSLAFYFSVMLYLRDDFDPGDLAVILIAQINAIYHSTHMLSTVSDLFMATDSAYRVMQFLDKETSYSHSLKEGSKPHGFEAKISFINVQFSYPSNLRSKVLHDLTLDVEPGKITAIVGTSGAGKSTIVDLASRLYDATDGQILIGGVDIRELNVSWLRNHISVVEQEPALFDTTIEENIRLGKSTATLEEIIEAAKISHAHSFIEKLPSGYDSVVGEGGTKLSGGQKQRIAIARAIVRKPKLLFLDEATSALDSSSEGIVQEALDNAMHGRTTIVIAHKMSTVRKADVIYALKDGRVLEKGSHDELMELKGFYYSLVKVQEVEEKDKSVKNLVRESTTYEEELVEKDILFNDDIEEEKQELEKRRILSLKNFKVIGACILALLFAVTTAAFLPIFYFIFTLFCQSFTHSNDEIDWIAFVDGGILLILGIVVFFSVILSGVTATVASQLWLKNLQIKAFNKIVAMDISWFDKSGNSPNECLEILTNSPPLIESVTGDKAAQVVIFMLSLVLCLCYSCWISKSITLVNLPIVLVFIILNVLRIQPRSSDATSAELVTRSTKVATEYVQNVKTIQLLNCQTYVIKLYRNMLILSNKEALASVFWYAVVYGLSKSLIRLSLATTFVFGAEAIANGRVRGTTLIGIVAALSSAAMLAGPAVILMSQYPAARQAITRLYRIAYAKTNLNTLTDEGDKPVISGNVVFQNVTFSYPTRDKIKVLNNLNLEIEAGKTLALVGDSGCGKSTIISLLERFYLPSGGKIMIDGNDINDINVRYLRSQMGLVSQEPILFDATIKENILYGLKEEEVAVHKIINAAKIANVHNFIVTLPLAYDTQVGERGSMLSGGQKQRIAIARAVLRNPKILLLDEATSALDTKSEKAVQKALKNASVDKTTIVIAHRLSTIREADKIVVLQSGVVIEEGNHDELMAIKGHYYTLQSR